MLSKVINNWSFLIYLLALFPLLPRGVESVLMGILFIVFLISLSDKKREQKITKADTLGVVCISIVPILFIISATYSKNLKGALEFIIRVFPLLILPLSIVGLNKRYKKLNSNLFLYIYVGAVFINTVFRQLQIYFSFSDKLTHWEYRQAFEEVTGVHGTYYSLWVAAAVIIIVFLIIKKLKERKLGIALLFLLMVVYLCYYQFVIGARMPVISCFLVLISYFIFLYRKKRVFLFVSVLVLGILITFIVKTKSNLYERIGSLIHYNFELPEGDYHVKQGEITNEQIRNGIYFCTFKIVKDNVFWGVGIGDVQDKLQHCYANTINSNVYNIFTFNTHNQYFLILTSNGIFGLLAFIASIVILIKRRKKGGIFMLIYLITLFCFLTENVLSRHDGVIFYGLFSSLLIFGTFEKNEKSTGT